MAEAQPTACRTTTPLQKVATTKISSMSVTHVVGMITMDLRIDDHCLQPCAFSESCQEITRWLHRRSKRRSRSESRIEVEIVVVVVVMLAAGVLQLETATASTTAAMTTPTTNETSQAAATLCFLLLLFLQSYLQQPSPREPA